METFTMYATIKIEVSTDLSPAEAVEEFTSDCDYFIKSTDNIKVVNTEWLETNLNQ